MALGKKPPAHAAHEDEVVCRWCSNAILNHCYRKVRKQNGDPEVKRNPQCGWYPCRKCRIVAIYDGLHQDKETGEWKYVIAGNTLADDPIIVVAKLALTGILVIITVYRDE